MPVVVTVDTEPDDAWANHLCESVQNVRAVRRFAALLGRYGAKTTLLVTYRVIQDESCVALLRELAAEWGTEIGAHLHPWENPPFMPSGADVKYATFPHELPPDVFADKLARLTDAIAQRVGPPQAYRAGRWGLSPAHLPVLERLGYEVDTSVIPLVDWRATLGLPRSEGGRGGIDYRFAPRAPYRPDYADVTRLGTARIVEIPVSVGFTHRTPPSVQRAYGSLPDLAQRVLRKVELLRPVWATPAWETGPRLARMTRTAVQSAMPVMNIALHSSELSMSSLAFTNTPQKVDELFRRITAMLDVLAQDGRCEFMTLSALGRRWRAAESAATELAPPASGLPRRAWAPAPTRLNHLEHSARPRRSRRPRSAVSPRPRAVTRPFLAQERPIRRLVYILAASHSGSTLLTMLLAAHRDICTVGELKAAIPGDIEQYCCSCGQSIRRCSFWERISSGMAQRGFNFDIAGAYMDVKQIDSAYVRRLLRPLHRGRLLEVARDAALRLAPTWRAEQAVIQRRNAALVDTICATTGRDVLIDSSKYAVRLKYLLRNPALDVQVIRLIRDGRSVALTYYLEERRLPMGPAAWEWRRSNEEAEVLLASVPRSRWIEVRYEALCADPRGTLARLCEFVGVDPSRATLDFRASEHHIVGNWMRLQTTSEIRLDERWKTALTPADLRAFDAVAGTLNRHYGYR